MHGSLVTSSLIREVTKNEFANEGYKFDQEYEKKKKLSFLKPKLLNPFSPTSCLGHTVLIERDAPKPILRNGEAS